MLTFDEVPSTTSLLLQCGYRSKVCTNIRATKLDGTLHKLCEFHRRKANLNQLKLHKRQREERAKAERSQSTKARSTKKARRGLHQSIEPIHHTADDFKGHSDTEDCRLQVYEGDFTLEDMHILEHLLFDTQPQPSPSLMAWDSPTSVDDRNPIIV